MMRGKQMSNIQEYGFKDITKKNEEPSTSMANVESQRAAQEVQAQYVIAKRFPRDENVAFSKIMKACERKFLAEQAIYAYPRGTQVVTGPSIRLAEVLSQAWGNLDAGIVEIEQSNGVSVCKAYATDLETNISVSKTFHVAHERHTRRGVTRLTDPRDIYELVANQGARRLRACLLGIIPADVAEAAVKQCEKTLAAGNNEPIEERVRKMVLKFNEIGIGVDHLEKRLGHKLSAIIETEIVTLGSIYKSIKDGMGKREDFFSFDLEEDKPQKTSEVSSSATQTSVLASKIGKNTKAKDDKVEKN